MAKRLPKEIQEALDRLEPRLAAAMIEAFQKMTDAVSLRQFETAILAGDVNAAIEALRIEGVWFSPVHDALRAAVIEGGGIALSGIRIKDPYDGTRFVLGFDGRHDRAEQWVRERSSELITEIVDDQRASARQVIEKGLIAGQNPRTVALDIVGRVNRATGQREGGILGLTSQQAQWSANAEAQLRDLDAGYFSRTKRDKRYDSAVRKAIKSGKPLAEADIKRIVTRYRDRLLKHRGDMIGRTEALNALRAGRHEGFAQLIDSGKVRQDQVMITWSATMDGDRTRKTHRAMNGQEIRFGQLFTSPSGAVFEFPGDSSHGATADEIVLCRCTATYRIKSDLMRD